MNYIYYTFIILIYTLFEPGGLIYTNNESLQVLQVNIVGIPHIPLNRSLSIKFSMTPIPIDIHLISYHLQ